MWEQTFFASAGADGSAGVEATGVPALALDAGSLAASPFVCREGSSQNSITNEFLHIAAHDQAVSACTSAASCQDGIVHHANSADAPQ